MDDLTGKIIIAVITAGLTIFGTWLVSGYTTRNNRAEKEKERRRHAEYLAVRMACTLDPFIEQCVAVTGDDGEANPKNEYALAVSVRAPKLFLPSDVEWKSIPPEMMYRILSLHNEIYISNRTISASWDDSCPPNYDEGFSERKYQYAKIGTLAFNIVTDLRAQYGIPTPDYSAWNPKDYLDKAFVAEFELRKRNVEMVQRMAAQSSELQNKVV